MNLFHAYLISLMMFLCFPLAHETCLFYDFCESKFRFYCVLSCFHWSLQLGKNKVFLRAGQIAVLDSRRAEVLDNSAKVIQCYFRMFLARRNYLNVIRVSLVLQAFCRGMTIITSFYGVNC